MNEVTKSLDKDITKKNKEDFKKYKKEISSPKKEERVIISVDDVVCQMEKMRNKLVQKRELSQKEEFKVVVTFSEIEKQLKANKPKRKKIEKGFNTLLKIFSRGKLSNTKEWIESLYCLKAGVSELVNILSL